MKNKTPTILLIVLLSLTAIILLVTMIFMLKGNLSFRHKSISSKLVLDKTYTGVFSKLEISADASDIEIKKTSEKDIRVIIYGDEERTSIDTLGNTLSITTTSKKCIGFCFNIEIYKVTIYLPKDYDGIIDIKNKYGDIEIDEFEKSSMTINEDCGDVSIEGAAELELENSYGNITIGHTKKANITADCGDIKIANIEEGQIENNYGDIKIDNVTRRIEINEKCGNVKIANLAITEYSTIDNSFGDITIEKTDEIFIDASTSLGETKINQNYPKSEVTLKIKNDCGNIKVKN